MNWVHLGWVALGGAAGAVLRWLVSTAVPSGILPWGTLLVNVLGSVGLGALMARVAPGGAHALWVIGFCGGFTTFSTFSWQLFEQLRTGQVGWALFHALLAVTGCVAGVALGWRLLRS